MELKDLKKGIIYYNTAFGKNYIFKLIRDATGNIDHQIFDKCHFTSGGSFGNSEVLRDIRLATEQEKQWFLACEQANKFIPKEEALKSFKQETKFIEGKWYKSYVGNYYKFLKLELNRWWSSEEILDKSYNKINDCRGPQIWFDDLVEIPLSEIQAYLPEGHVDKIKKEEPMDLLAEARKRYPIGSKFKCVNGNKNGGYSSYNKETDTWTVTDYRLTTVNDQPTIHSDNGWLYLESKWAQIISEAKQPEEEKWKVGGWVRITRDFEYRGISYKKGEVYKITYVNKTINPSVISVDALDKKVEMYTEFSSQIPECEWVGMEKPNSFGEQLNMKDIHTWSDWGPQNNLAYLLSSQEEPVRPQDWTVHAKKSKVQQVEVVPLQKPCIISTRKSKFKLQIN